VNNTVGPMSGEGMFSGVQDYYARYRPPITSEIVDTILSLCPSGATDGDMIDLGTGTGQVALAFVSKFRRIFAVEVDADMLARAQMDWNAINPTSSTEVIWEQCDVADYTVPAEASVSLVTTCRSFHWMDQPAMLARYAAQSGPAASFAVFGDSSFWESPQDWAQAVRSCVQSFLGEKRRARSRTFEHHRRPYAEIVAESEFSNVGEATVPVGRRWTFAQVIGYLYSTTFASRDLFGDRVEEFEKAVLEVLASYADERGILTESASFKIVVGTKP
jgi:trans-aconitate methyltransferase